MGHTYAQQEWQAYGGSTVRHGTLDDWHSQMMERKQIGCASTVHDGGDQFFKENVPQYPSQPPQHMTPSNLPNAPMGCNTSERPSIKGVRLKNKALPHPFALTAEHDCSGGKNPAPQSLSTPAAPPPPPKEAQEATTAAQEKATLTPMEWLNGSFRTDGEISAADGTTSGMERPLQRWDDGNGTMLNGTLEDQGALSHARCGTFDQFKVNREQFGVHSTFKEDLSQYTTPLNVSLVPTEVKDWARRIAKEIESQPARGRWCNGKQSGGGAQKYCGHDYNELEAGWFDNDDEEELWSSVPRAVPPPPPQCQAWKASRKGASWKQPSQWRVKV